MELASCEETISKNEKICIDCKTSKTPLWRSGPAGPKSLCNACGIRFRKKRSVVGSDKKREKQPPQPSAESSSSSTALCTTGSRNRVINNNCCGFDMKKGGKFRKNLRINLVALGKEVVLLQRPRSPMKKVKRQRMHQIQNQYKKFGEVEQAAFLLMSLSCGLVFG